MQRQAFLAFGRTARGVVGASQRRYQQTPGKPSKLQGMQGMLSAKQRHDVYPEGHPLYKLDEQLAAIDASHSVSASKDEDGYEVQPGASFASGHKTKRHIETKTTSKSGTAYKRRVKGVDEGGEAPDAPSDAPSDGKPKKVLYSHEQNSAKRFRSTSNAAATFNLWGTIRRNITSRSKAQLTEQRAEQLLLAQHKDIVLDIFHIPLADITNEKLSRRYAVLRGRYGPTGSQPDPAALQKLNATWEMIRNPYSAFYFEYGKSTKLSLAERKGVHALQIAAMTPWERFGTMVAFLVIFVGMLFVFYKGSIKLWHYAIPPEMQRQLFAPTVAMEHKPGFKPLKRLE